jgi:acylglycerol lipase
MPAPAQWPSIRRVTHLISRRRGLFAAAGSALLGLAGCASPGRPLPISTTPTVTNGAFTMDDGYVLPYRTWMPDGPPHTVIVALHGFNDSRDAWEYPAPAFQGAGIAIYGPDQRGFGATATRGDWAGVPRMVADATAMAAMVRARHPAARLVLMGESMGGALAMVVATQPNPPLADAYVLLAPAVWGREQMGVLLSSGLWIVSSVAPGWEVTGAEVPVRIRASDNREALIRLAEDPLTIRRTKFGVLRGLTDSMDAAQRAAPRFRAPGLFLYGSHDQLVPDTATAFMWRNLPGVGPRRALYPNAYHLMLRDHDRQAPTRDILAWPAEPDALLPSGADFSAAAFLSTHAA